MIKVGKYRVVEFGDIITVLSIGESGGVPSVLYTLNQNQSDQHWWVYETLKNVSDWIKQGLWVYDGPIEEPGPRYKPVAVKPKYELGQEVKISVDAYVPVLGNVRVLQWDNKTVAVTDSGGNVYYLGHDQIVTE